MNTVAEIMTTAVVTIEPQNSVATAIRLMRQGQMRRLPVVRDGDLVGIVTSGDLRRITGLSSILNDPSQDNFLWRHIPVENVMSRNPMTLESETPICEAARLLVESKIGGVPIVDQGKLVGIVTTSDLLSTIMNDNGCLPLEIVD